ncbi:MAG: hypothetical protein HC859_03720 [Bacteroidia bacterium]|nr:hypothetical protein [Bacteroidia bacterium]
MHEKNLGLDKDNVLILENMDRLGTNKEPFRNALAQQTGIEKVSYTNNSFPGVNNTTVFKAAGSDQDHIMGLYYADYEHFDVMKFQLKEGTLVFRRTFLRTRRPLSSMRRLPKSLVMKIRSTKRYFTTETETEPPRHA